MNLNTNFQLFSPNRTNGYLEEETETDSTTPANQITNAVVQELPAVPQPEPTPEIVQLETVLVKGIPIQPPPTAQPFIMSNRITPHELEMAELRVRVICQEKNNMALKMELKCAELQVAAKEKVDTQKTRLIELLDAKVANLEKKNNTLIGMVEDLIKDKETRSTRLMDATKNMQDLSDRLVESEKIKRELRVNNSELKTMLGNMEEKGSKIAKLAKEKLSKYRDDNVRMQGEIDDMKTTQEQRGKAAIDSYTTKWDKIDELGQLLEQILTTIGSEERPELAELVGSAKEINKETKQEVEQIRAGLSSSLSGLVSDNEKLVLKCGQLQQNINDLKVITENLPVGTSEESPESIKSAEQFGQLKTGIENLAKLCAEISG